MSATGRVRGASLWLASAVIAVAGAVTLWTPAEAGAKRGITTGIAAPEYQSLDGATRDLWFNRTVRGNADLVRIDVWWRDFVTPERPANPRDPADPAYHFSSLDAAVREAAQRGLKVHFTVFAAPDWAEGPNRRAGVEPGAWRPDPQEYGNFGAALAKRYSGSFSPAPGQPPLPRVHSYQAWNEPNLEIFLAPQWVDGRPEGPVIYRGLLNSFYDAVKGVDRSSVVVSGGTTSFGSPPGGDRTRPVFFIRELFCLRGRTTLIPGRCPSVKLDVLGHHPISTQNPPTYGAIHPDDAAMSDFDRLRRVLRAADKAGVVQPRGRRPIWATEFWWHDAVPLARQARYVEQALYVLWKQGVHVAIHYLVRDHPPYQGLFFPDGREKPAAQAFRFPFVTERLRGKRIRAWGRSPRTGQVRIQRKKGGGWKTLKRVHAAKGKVFEAKLRGRKQMRAQIGGESSLVWRNRG